MDFTAFRERRTAWEAVARRHKVESGPSLLGEGALAEIAGRYRASNTELMSRLGRADLELLLQPRTPPASAAPLEDLIRTPAYARFRAAVEGELAAGAAGAKAQA